MTWEELIEKCPDTIVYKDERCLAVLTNYKRMFYYANGDVRFQRCSVSFYMPKNIIAKDRTYEQMLMIMEALK